MLIEFFGGVLPYNGLLHVLGLDLLDEGQSVVDLELEGRDERAVANGAVGGKGNWCTKRCQFKL